MELHLTRLTLALLVVTAGCGDVNANTASMDLAGGGAAAVAGSVRAAGDSILPMIAMIERMQMELPAVTSLGADAPASLSELIDRFADAVGARDEAGLRAITIDAAEFAYLYFPKSIFAREPYAQPPAVNWLLLEQNSLKGQSRLLRYYGGRPLNINGYRCDDTPLTEGPNRIWQNCLVHIVREGGGLEEVRFFGSVLERGGRYKLVSLANRL